MFEHLKQLDPLERTAWLDLPMIAPGARVEMRYAGEGNDGYFNAQLALAGKRAREIQKRGNQPLELDPKQLGENRREDRRSFPAHVLVSWEGITTRDGLPVLCTMEARQEFCDKLPSWIFDRMRNFAVNPANFLAPGDELPPDAEELAGNS